MVEAGGSYVYWITRELQVENGAESFSENLIRGIGNRSEAVV